VELELVQLHDADGAIAVQRHERGRRGRVQPAVALRLAQPPRVLMLGLEPAPLPPRDLDHIRHQLWMLGQRGDGDHLALSPGRTTPWSYANTTACTRSRR